MWTASHEHNPQLRDPIDGTVAHLGGDRDTCTPEWLLSDKSSFLDNPTTQCHCPKQSRAQSPNTMLPSEMVLGVCESRPTAEKEC